MTLKIDAIDIESTLNQLWDELGVLGDISRRVFAVSVLQQDLSLGVFGLEKVAGNWGVNYEWNRLDFNHVPTLDPFHSRNSATRVAISSSSFVGITST